VGGHPGDWVLPAKDYAGTRFSELSQITAENVDGLEVAWTFSTGQLQGHEGTPLVVGDMMYFVTPFPNKLYGIDLHEPGTIAWEYNPRPQTAAKGVACCDIVNRGPAYGDGKVITTTLDNHVVAVDAETGEEVWDVQLASIDKGSSMTMAPLVVKNKVIVGNSGGEFGVRGWIAALDIDTGETVWKAYSTGSDEDVLIDHDFYEPFYEKEQGVDLGLKTWPPGDWKQGGGTVWGWITYDPELDLIYHGTANPGPWNPDLRPGDNKWTAALFARDPDDGRARWAYQVVPHDETDYDAANESILVDLPIDGEERKVLVHFNKNGFAFTIDRTNGEVLLAEEFGRVNWAFGYDLETGLPIKNPEKETGFGWTRHVCPVYLGVKDIQPAAFSPRTGLFYVPKIDLCMDFQGLEANYISGTPYLGAAWKAAAPDSSKGAFMAWDATTGTQVWEIEEEFPVWSGVLATGGDVVFYGTMDGLFKAVDARTGELLWEFDAGSGIIGSPMTYLGPDGEQYVAVLSGVGGNAAIPILVNAPANIPTAGAGLARAMERLDNETNLGGTLYVFALD
jgi:PQQ-dependent dehydrogenase (methanol/ethanol family)